MAKRDDCWIGDPVTELRVDAGFKLAASSTRAHPGFDGGKREGKAVLASDAARLSELQERLFARSTQGDPRCVLLVLQAMDTAGKGGIVGHVVRAVNPDGVRYHAFGKPTAEELAHDFLWRVERQLPGPGKLGVFDRSHYEDVLIGRVRQLAPLDEIERRYDAINDFERRIESSGTTIVKVMLHISRDEQKARLGDRLNRPEKYWKYNPADVDERMRWDDYQAAYQIVFERTSPASSPWYVVPADRKWYARLAVQQLLIRAFEGLHLEWPPANFDLEHERMRLAAS